MKSLIVRTSMRVGSIFVLSAAMYVSLADARGAADGRVYVMTNHAAGNSVLVYCRDAKGALQQMQEVATQGMGNGLADDGLGSQGSLTLSGDGNLLFAVNAASGDVTAFVVTSAGLQFGSKASSGGALPVSVTSYQNWVYVVNQLGIPNISGFTVDAGGNLTPIAGSSRALPGGALAQPAQVSFTPDGSELIVTEKGTNQIDIFPVQADGTTGTPMTQASSGKTPFGFSFGPDNTLIVAEAEQRYPMQATTSSYRIQGGGLTAVSGAVPDGQSGACWTVVTGQSAWVVNTGTAAISDYTINADSSLVLTKEVAASTGDGTSPTDVAKTSDSNFIYVIKSGTGQVAGYAVSGETLTLVFQLSNLPLSMQGIAAE